MLKTSNLWGIKWVFASRPGTPVYWKWKSRISSSEVIHKPKCNDFHWLMMRVKERDNPANYKERAEISALVPKVFSSSSNPACSARHLSVCFSAKWWTESNTLAYWTSQHSHRWCHSGGKECSLACHWDIEQVVNLHTYIPPVIIPVIFLKIKYKVYEIGSYLLPSALLLCWIYKARTSLGAWRYKVTAITSVPCSSSQAHIEGSNPSWSL